MRDTLKNAKIDASRRRFLKASGLAAIGTTISSETFAQAAEVPPTVPAPTASNGAVDAVNILQGANSTQDFSRGNTLPIAALPFGMAHWTLQSHEGTPWMFQPDIRRIQGVRCTHQLSPWLDDYGYATFLPFRGEIHPEAVNRASSYRPEDARLTPYSLQLFLLRYRVQVELVPTERCALLTAIFDEEKERKAPGLAFDVPGKASVIEPDPANRRILFTSTINSGGVPDNFATYYVLQFPEAWEKFEVKQSKERKVAMVSFPASLSLEVKIGTSFISFEQAQLNLQSELSAPATDLRASGKARWNEFLSRIEVQDATSNQQQIFYSCMYRALLFPRTWHELNAHGEMHHFSAFNGRVMPGLMYADHGYWDVYRAWYPLMSVVFPDRLGDILQSWVNAYKEGGWLPQFPAPGYRACMTGSLIDSIFGDAAAKGISGFNLEDAYEGLKKHASTPGDPAKGYGRVGIEDYVKYHYLPADRIPQSVAETVDAAYGDFCIAQVAKATGKHEDYIAFMQRSDNWRNVFDPGVRFFRGKNEDRSWVSSFDPFTWGSPYVEGGAWQHRWDAPHDIMGLIEAMGGKGASAAALEEMLKLPPIFGVGVYGKEIHEMSEMAAVLFGQYAHSNQPVHHLLYVFAHAGRPDLTQYWVRKVMRELYTPETFPGDEDTGSMAAWFILSSLGLYAVCPGKPEYTLGSPLFKRATLHLPGNKTFVIEAPGNSSSAVFVQSVQLNGRPHAGVTLEHASLVQGGTLRFEMAN